MVHAQAIISSYSVDDLDAAREFYGETLGLTVTQDEMGTLGIDWAGEQRIFIYPKEDHTPASVTVLNLRVDDVDAAVDELNARGVTTKIYGDDEIEGMPNDEKGIVRGSDSTPEMAWFRDPAGNVIALLKR
jgi:catechol 2,3-dioxygenase-like lactoylglutathione lyase family enzyme